jgi:hypothetical protein
MKQNDTNSLDTRRLDEAEKQNAIITANQMGIAAGERWYVEVNGRGYFARTLRQALDDALAIQK